MEEVDWSNTGFAQLEALKNRKEKLNSAHTTSGSCPNCGYCPHCGRGGWGMSPYWTYPWYQPYIVWCGGGSNTQTFSNVSGSFTWSIG